MSIMVAIIFILAGAAIAGALAIGWTALTLKAIRADREMLRLGAESGPTSDSRRDAERQLSHSARMSWGIPVLVWGFRLFGAALGGGLGLVLAKQVGALA